MAKDIGKKFEKLVEIMARLRAPDGCPWDREQTYKDINPYMLEEVHEVMESIDKNDMNELKEELGDLLLHIVFHAEMATEDGFFTIEEVIDGICEKLIYRHPHVFGDKKVKGTKDVLENWETLKKKEKEKSRRSLLDGVPKELPALLKAYRLGEKAGRVGFDWEDANGILEKLEEEVHELHEARGKKDLKEIEHEYGDVLFTLANIGRFMKVNPEDALRKATNRFIQRFGYVEEMAKEKKADMRKMPIAELEKLWQKAKKKAGQ